LYIWISAEFREVPFEGDTADRVDDNKNNYKKNKNNNKNSHDNNNYHHSK
jgi:hypothetical protein